MTADTEEALLLEYLPYATRIAERRGRGRLSDDLASDAALALLLALRRYDASRGIPLRSYLGQIIPRLLVDLHRERHGRRGSQRNTARTVPLSEHLAEEAHTPARLAELRDEVRHALRCLGRREAMVLWLCLGEGQEQRQVAARLGVVSSRVSQIVRAALAEVQAHESYGP